MSTIKYLYGPIILLKFRSPYLFYKRLMLNIEKITHFASYFQIYENKIRLTLKK